LRINPGEAEDKRFKLLEPEGRVFKSPEASLRFIKKRLRQVKRCLCKVNAKGRYDYFDFFFGGSIL